MSFIVARLGLVAILGGSAMPEAFTEAVCGGPTAAEHKILAKQPGAPCHDCFHLSL
jgi:hypothetical protein